MIIKVGRTKKNHMRRKKNGQLSKRKTMIRVKWCCEWDSDNG